VSRSEAGSDVVWEQRVLTSALKRVAGVGDCAVLVRTGARGSERIAYLVPVGRLALDTVAATLEAHAPGVRAPDSYALVTRLPLAADGSLDEAALSALPVIDEPLAEALEARLASDPAVEQAAAFVEETPGVARALHLSDLIGTSGVAGALLQSGDDGDRANGQGSAIPAPEAVERPLALSHGAPLDDMDVSTLPALLTRRAETAPGARIVYLSPDGSTREQSLAELRDEAARIAAGLQALGLAEGRQVVFQLSAVEDVLAAFWGCLLGGFVPAIIPIPPTYNADTNDLERLVQIFRLLDAPQLLTTEKQLQSMGPLLERLELTNDRLALLDGLRASQAQYHAPPARPDDTAFLVLTSGSTGTPKAIMLSHANLLTRSRGTNRLCSHAADDRILNWLPFDHIGSISDWHIRCIDVGCHMFYCAKEYVLGEPLNWLRLIDRFRITHSWAPNFAYALVNDALNHTSEHWDLSSMKALLTAGEAVSSNTVHEFLRRLAPEGLAKTALRPAFGMAETGSGVTYYLPTEQHPLRVQHVDRNSLDGALRAASPGAAVAMSFTSLGPVIPGASMRIVNEQNQPLPEYFVGRLQISGGPVCLGYYGNPQANQSVFVGDGWFDCGDRGFLLDGELYLTGRDKESLIINGANYHNSEIEAAVSQVPGVLPSFTAACAVRPIGAVEEQLAIFFATATSTERELNRLLRAVQTSVSRKTSVKPDYLLPVPTDAIPKTAIGKIQRKQLTKRFESGEFDALTRDVDVLLENERTLPDWFLEPGFRAKRAQVEPLVERAFLVWGAPSAFADELGRELGRRGLRVFRTESLAEADALLAGDASLTDVIDVQAYAAHDPSAPLSAAVVADHVFEQVQRIQRLAKAVASTGAARALRYQIVAAHAQPAAPDDVIDPRRAVLPAALKAIAQERPEIRVRHVDLTWTSEASELTRLAAAVVDEAATEDAEDEVAYRAGLRLVPYLRRVRWSGSPADRVPPLAHGALYLITGGLGGVGAELARYLLKEWQAKLIVVGRRTIDLTAPAPSGSAGATLQELQALGTLRYLAADIGNSAEVLSRVAAVENELAERVAGAFHLAGTYHEAPLFDESRESLGSYLHAKVDGALTLRELTARDDAFLVQFSSAASFFSGSSIGTYAIANRFLDVLAHAPSHGRAVRSYAFDWSVWTGLGIGKDSAPADVLRSKGYAQIRAVQGIHSMVAALGRGPGRYLVGVYPAHPNLRGLTDSAPEPAREVVAGYIARPSEGSALGAPQPIVLQDRFGVPLSFVLTRLLTPVLGADGKLDRDALAKELRGTAREVIPAQTPLQLRLVEIFKQVLGLTTLGINESFFDLGGTSLLSVRLFAEIERQLGPSLPPATLFQAATVEALAQLVEERPEDAEPAGAPVALKNGSSELALFFIHDSDGSAEIYRELADSLKAPVRVYGLRPYQRDRFPALHTRIADMAKHHVATVRSLQPHGPYLIGGWSQAGVLALEVACQLQAQGETVGLVALFDAVDARAAARDRGLNAVMRSLRGARDTLRSGGWKELADRQLKPTALAGVDRARALLLRYYTDRQAPLPWFLQHVPVRAVQSLAESGYRPSRFDGRLTLFRAELGQATPDDEPARARCPDAELGWGARATQGVEVIDVPGGHQSMLSAPAVSALAAQLTRALSDTLAASKAR
jgi:acyl-CoA synthetase (AMP-forming)/AMP-acid ligase II/thioesterase domain-containing protein/NADP-dependent 3-hydroxy acid dehydrogenase YdfG/acyl carrier protein